MLIKCKNCGSNISDKAEICPKCGFVLKDENEIEKSQIQEGILCEDCGYLCESDSKFCVKCGRKFEQTNEVRIEEIYQERDVSSNKKDKKDKKVFVFVGIGLAVVAIGVFAFFFFGKPKTIEVPNVLGMEVSEATKVLSDLGFAVKEENKGFSNIAVNKIGETVPNAGEIITKGSEVTIYVNNDDRWSLLNDPDYYAKPGEYTYVGYIEILVENKVNLRIYPERESHSKMYGDSTAASKKIFNKNENYLKKGLRIPVYFVGECTELNAKKPYYGCVAYNTKNPQQITNHWYVVDIDYKKDWIKEYYIGVLDGWVEFTYDPHN